MATLVPTCTKVHNTAMSIGQLILQFHGMSAIALVDSNTTRGYGKRASTYSDSESDRALVRLSVNKCENERTRTAADDGL